MRFEPAIPVIPIGVFSDSSKIVKVAEILLKHGINCIEAALRTPNSYECIRVLRKEFPGMHIGAGSVLTRIDFTASVDAGASFIVSPSANDELIELSHSYADILYIPGFATPSELGHILNKGMTHCKFFPAEHCGGAAYLRAVMEPFARFTYAVIPTGGIQPSAIKSYLSLPSVMACGMSYIVDSRLIHDNDFTGIENRVKEVAAIVAQ